MQGTMCTRSAQARIVSRRPMNAAVPSETCLRAPWLTLTKRFVAWPALGRTGEPMSRLILLSNLGYVRFTDKSQTAGDHEI